MALFYHSLTIGAVLVIIFYAVRLWRQTIILEKTATLSDAKNVIYRVVRCGLIAFWLMPLASWTHNKGLAAEGHTGEFVALSQSVTLYFVLMALAATVFLILLVLVIRRVGQIAERTE